MFSDLSWAALVGSIAYLGVVSVLGYAAIVQGNHDALLALIAIVSPASGAAAVTFLKRETPPTLSIPPTLTVTAESRAA